MLDWTRPRATTSIAQLLAFGATHGLDPDALLQGSGLTRDFLADRQHRVHGLQEIEVTRNLLAALPEIEHLGLLAGQTYNKTVYGHLGFAWASCSTWVETLRLTERFLPLTLGMVHADISFDADLVRGVMLPGTLPADVTPFYLQRELAAVVSMGRELTGLPLTHGATFTQSAPGSAEAAACFTDLFGPNVLFGAARTTISVDTRTATMPLPQAAPATRDRMIAACERELADLLARSEVSTQVSTHIHALLASGARLEDVAQRMSVSPRTLRRQLQAEGASFRDLLDEVRAQLAGDLLLNSDRTVAQISADLGYDNPSAFSTAFRRWQRTTPSDFRATRETSAGPAPATKVH